VGHGFEYRITILILLAGRILLAILIKSISVAFGQLLHSGIRGERLQELRLTVIQFFNMPIGEHDAFDEFPINHRGEFFVNSDVQRDAHFLKQYRTFGFKLCIGHQAVFL